MFLYRDEGLLPPFYARNNGKKFQTVTYPLYRCPLGEFSEKVLTRGALSKSHFNHSFQVKIKSPQLTHHCVIMDF